MKICLYSKCQKKFEPKKPKAKFCSAKCRVYHSRELGAKILQETQKTNMRVEKIETKIEKIAQVVSEVKQKVTLYDMPPNLTWLQKIAWKNENGIK